MLDLAANDERRIALMQRAISPVMIATFTGLQGTATRRITDAPHELVSGGRTYGTSWKIVGVSVPRAAGGSSP